MRDNINKVSQRGERLDALQDKTDNLAVSAQGFRRGANRVRKQMWWKDMKMRIWIIVGIICLLIVIIVPSGEFCPFFNALKGLELEGCGVVWCGVVIVGWVYMLTLICVVVIAAGKH